MRQLARFAAALLITILLIAGAVFAQRPATGGGVSGSGRFEITGTVTDEAQHSPVQGAQVQLNTANGEIITSAYAGTDGEFAFPNMRPGSYKLVITANGFEQAQQDILIVNTSVESLKIILVKTVASKSESAATNEVVSARELNLPSKAQDALAKGKDHLYQKHDPAGSLPFFRKVTDLAPGFYEAYYDEGIAYTLQKQNDDAETAFRKAIATSQDHYAEPCFALASLLTDQKHFADAEQLARRGIEIQPDAWRGDYELARALLGEGKLADAEKSGIEARKRKEDFPALYLILANIHLQLHNNEAVLDDVNTFLKLDPSGPNSGQAREIKSQMERALGRSPEPNQPQG